MFIASIALLEISCRLPIGVETMYKPGTYLLIIYCFIFISSCSPVNLSKPGSISKNKPDIVNQQNKVITKKTNSLNSPENIEIKKYNFEDSKLDNTITILFSEKENERIVNQFINIIELGVYDKNLKNVNLDIRYFSDSEDINKIVSETSKVGKIYIGPIKNEMAQNLNSFCKEGVIFFSFSSNTNLANKCVFLINFFPKNELEQLFNFLDTNSKVALLYPENKYGYMINGLIDDIANESDSVLINRSSYKSNLSNVRDAIKELGKYELRKYELNRQKKILYSKKDDKSKKRLKKLEKFKTTSDYDFTHVLIADYGLNLLQVAPLLTYYDIDPNIVQFMGTGVIDDDNFFTEPSLQSTIFPGVEKDKRYNLMNNYEKIYDDKFIRISTLPYDLIGILNYLFTNSTTVYELFDLINDKNIRFDGVDGNFYFKDNMIERDLNILKIQNGFALKIN